MFLRVDKMDLGLKVSIMYCYHEHHMDNHMTQHTAIQYNPGPSVQVRGLKPKERSNYYLSALKDTMS